MIKPYFGFIKMGNLVLEDRYAKPVQTKVLESFLFVIIYPDEVILTL